MGTVIWLSDRREAWYELFKVDRPGSTLQVYANRATGELEIIQMNDDGEMIRTCMDADDSVMMGLAIAQSHRRFIQDV